MRKLIVIWTCLLFTIPCEADTFIVDPNGFEDFNNIQDAINYSWHGDTVIVRPGTYNENIYFNGRAITLTSENPNDPNVVDSTIITANSGYSVTFDFGENSDSVLAGFTITGRGIYCYASSPTIKNNIIRDCDNYGISGGQGAAPIISDNSISNIFSAGIFNCHGPINNNIVSGNRRGISECDGSITYNKIANNAYGGAGAGLYDCDGTIANNIILGNEVTSGSGGGGGGLSNCNGNIINNIISGNKAVTGGGGLSDCTNVFNNTIVGNMANTGAALSGCDFISNNIIAFNNALTSIGGIYGAGDNSYNNFWMNEGGNFGGGATVGIGDTYADPFFAIQGYWDDNGTPSDKSDDFWVEGDYHLKSAAGRWDPNTETWVIDDINSPCIDAGDPSDDIGLEPNPNGGRINIGAYGSTAEASKSSSGVVEPICTEYPAMDFNKDCKVDFKDFATFTQSWLECNLQPQSACWE